MSKNSWEKLEKNTLIKNLDYSSFYERNSAIPQDFYSFFNASAKNEEKIKLTLVNNKIKFNATINTKTKPNKKKYIGWDVSFSNLLKEEFINWKNIKPYEKTVDYKLVFSKTNNPSVYLVSTSSANKAKADLELIKIKERDDINETEKLRLTKSRIGQGIYRSNLMQIESKCRVTGLTDSNYLIASHIKPWSHSDDSEKLDGNNGLLLSPHIDKLFDQGYISFTNNGRILISEKINPDVILKWGINKKLNIGSLNRHQAKYLEYHQSNIFKK